MQMTGPEEKETHRLVFSLDHSTRAEDEPNPPESPFDLLPPGKPREPAWTSSGRGSLMESMATSLWSWLLVGILSAWFSIWLIQAIGHLGSRLP